MIFCYFGRIRQAQLENDNKIQKIELQTENEAYMANVYYSFLCYE